MEKVRDPIIGERIFCGVCHSDCGEATQEFVTLFNTLPEERRKSMYMPFPDDCFLGYDGCEENAHDMDEIYFSQER
ncbi:MAG: hypothetical protein ACYDG3_09985 [Bacillati bacterium]